MLVNYLGDDYLVLNVDGIKGVCHLLPTDKITLGKEEILKDLLKQCIKVDVKATNKAPFKKIDFEYYRINKYEVVKIDAIPKEPKLRVDITTTTNNHTYHISNFIMRDITSDEDVIDILASEGYSIDDEDITSMSATVFYKDFSNDTLILIEYNSTRE